MVDCANGPVYRTARLHDWSRGTVGDNADGFNINEDCGAVHPQVMAAAVVAHGADAGICLDGDADG